MKTAMVVGGGIAGLASAKILTQHFDKVIIFDGGPQPQANHLHVLLKKGQDLLEEIFPGMLKQMSDLGCPEIDWALDTIWENHAGVFPRYSSTVKTLSMSRILLQKLMREALAKLLHVSFVHERVESLQDLQADLVVIAAGQYFPCKEFVLSQEVLPINLTYRSFVFKQEDLNLGNSKQYYYQVDPPHTLVGGVICPIEEGKMMVTLIESETSLSGCTGIRSFMKIAERIPGQKFHTILGNAQPITELAVFRKNTTHRKRLDHSKIPANTIILGDVLTSLNPVFGQGMTVSLMQVELLDQMLKGNFDSCKFHQAVHRLGVLPYTLSKLGSQERGIGKASLRGYLRACQSIPPLHHNFLKRLHNP